MAAYSLDLRKRVCGPGDSGLDADSVAAKYEVSRAWVHRLVQRRRETGSIEPRKQSKFRSRVLSPQQEDWGALISAPGRDVGGIAGGAADRGRADHAVADHQPLGLHP
jgi:transposase